MNTTLLLDKIVPFWNVSVIQNILHNEAAQNFFAPSISNTFLWKRQLPILMYWVRPDYEILSQPSTHQWTLNFMMLEGISIQIKNGYECNGTDIFMRLEMECSIQRGKAELNRTFHL